MGKVNYFWWLACASLGPGEIQSSGEIAFIPTTIGPRRTVSLLPHLSNNVSPPRRSLLGQDLLQYIQGLIAEEDKNITDRFCGLRRRQKKVRRSVISKEPEKQSQGLFPRHCTCRRRRSPRGREKGERDFGQSPTAASGTRICFIAVPRPDPCLRPKEGEMMFMRTYLERRKQGRWIMVTPPKRIVVYVQQHVAGIEKIVYSILTRRTFGQSPT